jgi:type 1 glutamine amidotransferase
MFLKLPRARAALLSLAAIPLAALVGLAGLANRAAAQPTRVLIFHKQNGYIHTATPAVVAALKANWTAHGLEVASSVDSLDFNGPNLALYDAVVFLNTNYRNGPLFARAQEAAFEAYIRGGGAFVGLHSAIPLNGTMEESVWPWYASLYGARFRSHAPYGSGAMVIEDPSHFSTRGLPLRITLQDEWYAMQANPRNLPGVRVLATVDETGFQADSRMGGDHPVTWSRTFEGGRSWVTVIGHDMGAFSNSHFMTHVRRGVMWAAGVDSATTALTGPGTARAAMQAVERGAGRGTALSYTTRAGERLEVRLDGRVVTARRAPADARGSGVGKETGSP